MSGLGPRFRVEFTVVGMCSGGGALQAQGYDLHLGLMLGMHNEELVLQRFLLAVLQVLSICDSGFPNPHTTSQIALGVGRSLPLNTKSLNPS